MSVIELVMNKPHGIGLIICNLTFLIEANNYAGANTSEVMTPFNLVFNLINGSHII